MYIETKEGYFKVAYMSCEQLNPCDDTWDDENVVGVYATTSGDYFYEYEVIEKAETAEELLGIKLLEIIEINYVKIESVKNYFAWELKDMHQVNEILNNLDKGIIHPGEEIKIQLTDDYSIFVVYIQTESNESTYEEVVNAGEPGTFSKGRAIGEELWQKYRLWEYKEEEK